VPTSKIKWSSTDESVVTVDADGKIAAVGPGTAAIQARAGGVTDQCEVIVGCPLQVVLFRPTGGQSDVRNRRFFVYTSWGLGNVPEAEVVLSNNEGVIGTYRATESFTVDFLLPGKYEAEISSEGYADSRLEFELKADELKEDGHWLQELPLMLEGQCKVYMRDVVGLDADGNPLPNRILVFGSTYKGESFRGGGGRTGSDGRFDRRFAFAEGVYFLELQKNPGAYNPKEDQRVYFTVPDDLTHSRLLEIVFKGE